LAGAARAPGGRDAGVLSREHARMLTLIPGALGCPDRREQVRSGDLAVGYGFDPVDKAGFGHLNATPNTADRRLANAHSPGECSVGEVVLGEPCREVHAPCMRQTPSFTQALRRLAPSPAYAFGA